MQCLSLQISELGIYPAVHLLDSTSYQFDNKSSAEDVIQQLLPLLVHGTTVGEEDQHISVGVVLKQSKTLKKSKKEHLLIRICHSWDGVKLCLKHSSAKEFKMES